MADENGINAVGTPYDEQAFKEMTPEARDWHIMSEVYQIKTTCVARNRRIKSLEKRRKTDTTLAVFVGAVSGFFGALARNIKP